MDFSYIDILKIVITAVSALCLWYFRRNIVKTLTDLVIHDDSDKFKDKSMADIVKTVDVQLEEVLK